jgi:hypothetical protein
MSLTTRPLSLTVNGKKVGPVGIPDSLMMLDFLNEYLSSRGQERSRAYTSRDT